MATWLKQSTAVEIKLGPFLDETDGKTAEEALTIEDEHVDLAKNGGDWGDKAETTTCVHESQGWYRCLLDATDTGTLGILIVKVHVSGALPVWREFMVVPANVYDSVVAGSDTLDVQVAGMGANVMTAAAAAADLTTELQSGLATAAALDTVDNFLDTEIAAIKAKTDLIPGTIDGKTFEEAWMLVTAVLLGKASGMGTTTGVFRSMDDGEDRVTATIDADGNRTAVTYNTA